MQLMTIRQVARQLGVRYETVRGWIDAELLPAIDLAPGSRTRRLRVTPQQVEILLERLAYRPPRTQPRRPRSAKSQTDHFPNLPRSH